MKKTKTNFFQLFDIAYVIPATVFMGYWLGSFLENKYGGDLKTYSIMVFAMAGFILTFFKIKKFVDSVNAKTKEASQKNSDS